MPLAHETWFTEDIPPTNWDFAGETLTLVYLGAALAPTLSVLLVYGSDPRLRPWCSRLWPWTGAAVRAAPAPACD